MKELKFREKVASRKFVIMLTVLLSSTLMLLMPSLVLLSAKVKLAAIMTGGEYTSLIIGTFGIYAGANVFQKKIEQGNNVSIEEGELK